MIEQGDTEVLDAVVVIEPQPGSELIAHRSAAPAARTAAAAAGGLVAGALLARLFSGRREGSLRGFLGRKFVRKRPDQRLSKIVASRSLLVDVHLLDAPRRSR